ncbi:UDP-glucose 4-epimerase GalE [Solibacillus sp. FSL H8-0538]|uniref:UDP-glucose 4-epimerase GalE n=1 Tax=Solibacillus sp. FSL H8-0538 TaxID=2921400 RepID=UPI0030FCF608
MHILVSGGLGYIGSHTCLVLLEAGHTISIVDNLINSKIETLEKLRIISTSDFQFYQCDILDYEHLETIVHEGNVDGIIHFAGLKSVGESVSNPLEYYRVNLNTTINLTRLAVKYKIPRFVFSSSATVYGSAKSPLVESQKLLPTTNPYGETKAMCEKILNDASQANPNLGVTLLRYFNPIGAHESGLIGENPNGTPNNLMPYITQVAKGKLEKLKIFGNDYPTNDGTGVRDFIHVMDLAKGHVAAIEKQKSGVQVYNLGTGKGTSVLEIIKTFERVNNLEIPYEFIERRNGDIAEVYANVLKVGKELGWKTERNIEDMCRDAWRFENQNSQYEEEKFSELWK